MERPLGKLGRPGPVPSNLRAVPPLVLAKDQAQERERRVNFLPDCGDHLRESIASESGDLI